MLRPAVRSLGRLGARSSVYVNHRDTEANNDQTRFEFTPENYAKIKWILKKYPANYKKSGVIPILMLAQKQNNNFLSLSAMHKIAKILEMPRMAVYEVASFYTMFNRTPVGKYHLQVCGTTPCMVRGAREVISAIEKHLGIENGGTSEDGLFTLQEVECLGACVNAPMMQVNNEWFYEDLNPENTVEMLKKWQAGEEPEIGPQISRNTCEGPEGRTSLHEPEKVNRKISRDFAAAKQAWDEMREKAKKG